MLRPLILRKHQQRFIDSNPNKALLCWEMRTGKSLPATMWGQLRSDNCIVVCPKQLVNDWKTLAPFATVFSKEQFKKNWKTIKKPSALIVDECHTFASPLFTKNRSQLATAMYSFVKDNPEMGVLLLSATPIRNDPSSLHTLLCYIGVYIPWKDWRDVFYELQYRPYLPRPAYFPKSNWRITIRTVLEKYADIVSLKDCVDYLPPVTSEIVKIDTPKYIRPTDEEYRWTNEHQHEQINKAEYIKSLGYRKIIIACHYTFQIDELKKILEKERPVFVLDGRTKDPDLVKKQAKEADECYWILQSSMGFGLDAWMFGALVFASMSHTALHHTQMTGRMTSVDYPKPIFMYYLIGGIWDKRIYDSIIKNQDFNPHIYLNEK
jgi:superfamily II DNA or RNA helicase